VPTKRKGLSTPIKHLIDIFTAFSRLALYLPTTIFQAEFTSRPGMHFAKGGCRQFYEHFMFSLQHFYTRFGAMGFWTSVVSLQSKKA
jgi:hypothetical protein